MATLLASAIPFLQMWGGDHMDGWGWGSWFAMIVVMLLFWATVAGLVVWAIRSTSSHIDSGVGSGALDIARERYARGEISEDEFQRIRAGLR